ncbi:hypothetical protein [Corallococcus llansteffanensis]|uniref:Uncharacterized protein n=1 Tax=Corallococcus llansteffanensis TaxID=2316731 RepID=A0A3A8QCG9_9BACT|nr:hypothetical protein [Corallococcus llansteffanensis]RKH65271.1 hypothetical protein D7V93_06295 [Corallococcus llansteffanensis]
MHFIQVEFDDRRAAEDFRVSLLERKLARSVNYQVVMKSFVSVGAVEQSEIVVLTFKTDQLNEVQEHLKVPTFKSGSAVYWEVKEF